MRLIITLIGIVFYGSSCLYKSEDPVCNNTPVEVGFQRDILPIFAQHCTAIECHSGSSPAGNLKLEPSVAYAQLSRVGKGYLDTINAKSSVLYASMNSRSDPMPPDGRLDVCTVELVLEWITQKAKDN
ncbi:MAG: hypothetical protein KA109_05505 [Saprospiraceae bacterium]|nr:hypothetical protein [Saprospiraceae bacterium]MBK6814745.1 hypothetical protein [Saprospiraceae bacterium]MBK7370134.1 hypothetical protein [Saprospiraceae bacterium]MBK7437839.1 hypothetical protein [Saprospiraceae bacterium]MBK7606947.1 hypothetical protein [Saprospiraceae bacterium]